MAEDSQKRKDDLPKHPLTKYQPGPEDYSEAHFQQSVPSQLSKEKLYQKRQKCELRRLMKHTHPELKMLDDVVDEELAEVLSSETGGTTGETGYEGEVLSRRLIFETCALTDKVSPYSPKRHMAEGKADVSKKSAAFEQHEERPCSESAKGITRDDQIPDSSPDSNTEEEMIKIDVQATRRMFENQSVNTSRQYQYDKFQGKVSTSGTETGIVQKPKQECRKEGIHSESKSNVCTKSLDLTDQPLKQELITSSTDNWFSDKEDFSNNETIFEDEDEPASPPDSQNFGDTIKTSASLFKNNPFIQTNVERENSFGHTSKPQSPVEHSGAAQQYPIENVKNRAHLFESMPFNKIRHQNKDEVETMVEKIKETLNFLHQVNAIHSGGSIIEVNETMIAKKAKFTLSEAGPEIKYDEVAEGGAQNFVLQLLPRTNLKPQIIYLKEDSKRTMEATVVNVPVHHHHQFATNQDTEFKTANVVQVVEDILNQDNSLRKGVIIQEGVNRCAEVIVYSLYNYFNEEDVKSYCPPQGEKYNEPQSEKGDMSKMENQGLRKGAIESTTSCLLETSKVQTNEGSKRPEITEKGNVKLFKCCIERGDLEYLKSLQTESTEQEQEVPPNQNVAGHQTQTGDQAEESASEFVPVDVKKLKNIFSGDPIPALPKQDVRKNLAQSNTVSSFASQNVPLGKSQPSTKCDAGVNSDRHHNDTFKECTTQKQEESCNSTVAPQGSCLQLETQDDGRVHKAELVEVVDDNDEIDNLQIAIHNLRQATIEAKALHHSSQVKQNFLAQESSEKSVVLAAASNVRHSRTEAELPQENEVQKEDSCVTQPRWIEFPLASNIISDCHSENTEKCRKDSEEVQTDDTCSNIGQKGTEDVQKPALVSVHSSETTATQQEDDEVVLQGKLQAALNSLERSNINVTRGDFRAAMIYKNSSKPRKQTSQNIDAISNQKHSNEEVCPVTEDKSTQAPLRQEVSKEHVILGKAELPSQSKISNKKAASAVLETNKRPVGPKPAIPPKPEHLKVNQKDIQSTTAKNLEATKTVRPKETVPQPLPITLLSSKDEHVPDMFIINSGANTEPALQTNKCVNDTIPMSQEIEVSHQVQGSVVTLESDNTDKNAINQQQEMKVPFEKKQTQTFPVKDDMNETDESPVDFQGACRKFEGKSAVSVKHAPVKPKRVKIAQSERKNPKYMSGDDNPSLLAEVFQEPQQTPGGPSFSTPKACGQTPDTKDKHEKDIKQESKVEMREKKGRAETEDERRQRLSVHMDEIVRGNITAAMEIFDNLRKQEELQSILSRVEEIEQDTREVDVRSLRGVFENVPDWVVCSDKKKQKKAEVENKDKRMLSTRDTESKSSVAHVFGDLERASEEIMNLKEQTLSRLLDIEEAIKKALYSVSTLKSDSDIAGLSCLFKESLGTVRGSPSSGNISKISIGSSRTKSMPIQESHTAQGYTALPVSQSASVEAGPTKQQVSPPSSPAFISIQSAARRAGKTEVLSSESIVCPACQHSPKTEEKFRTTKTLTCNSPAQNRKKDPRKGGQKQSPHKPSNPNRELSVPEMQTDREVNNIMDTKTVTENYERTDNLGNRFYSSKTSTVVTAPPDTTTSTSHAVISPATYQVTKYPEVWLPVNQKP